LNKGKELTYKEDEIPTVVILPIAGSAASVSQPLPLSEANSAE